MLTHRPQLIVVTPVRNEAWVLEAFLTHCSSWADRIIIADQHSTDSSREIALRFPKVTLIDNPTDEWIENVCRAHLLEEAQRIEGDKIIFALDADEFLSSGFEHSASWQQILQSTPNIVFQFRWFNLYGDLQHGAIDGGGAEWAAHYSAGTDIAAEYRRIEHHAVHCMRVPCLEIERCGYTLVEDIRFVHLGNLSRPRTRNKLDFYQVVNHDKNPVKSNPIRLYRSYTDIIDQCAPLLDTPVRLTTLGGEDITHLVRTADHGQHYIDEIVAILRREGCRKFASLCIWDNPDLVAAGIHYRPPLRFRLLHRYLRATQPHRQRLAVRIVDKVLKAIF